MGEQLTDIISRELKRGDTGDELVYNVDLDAADSSGKSEFSFDESLSNVYFPALREKKEGFTEERLEYRRFVKSWHFSLPMFRRSAFHEVLDGVSEQALDYIIESGEAVEVAGWIFPALAVDGSVYDANKTGLYDLRKVSIALNRGGKSVGCIEYEFEDGYRQMPEGSIESNGRKELKFKSACKETLG